MQWLRLLAIAVVFGAGLLSACGSPQPAESSPAASVSASAPSAAASAPQVTETAAAVTATAAESDATETAAAGGDVEVVIGDNTFTPPELNVAAGTTVIWRHEGQRPHTVTADDGSFDSGTLDSGASFEQTFATPGTYAYFCEFHGSAGGQGMAGVVTVGAGASDAAGAAPTPTFERVTDAEPTVGALSGSGTGAWRDQTLRNDAFVVALKDAPALAAGEVYAAWLSGEDNSLPLGTLGPDASGTAVLTFVSPEHTNLLRNYSHVYITQGPEAAATSSLDNVVMYGRLPDGALVHIRHVLVGIESTPNEIGFALGLRQETDELLRHAQFLKDAFDAGNLALEKLHAEHIVNIAEGSEGANFGDLNGDGKVQNPGDGFGVLQNGAQDGYVEGMNKHARLAAEATDATDGVKLHAEHVQIAGENTRVRVTDIRDRALSVAQSGAVGDTQENVLAILAQAQQTIQGIDLDLDEQIGPVPGEGGVLTAYQHAQLMAGVPLEAGTPSSAPAPPLAEATPEPEPTTVTIGDNTYEPNRITVASGTTVLWRHEGQRPHTVTADDGAFDSQRLENGASFEQRFDSVGTFPYYCTFHGGPGGERMSGTVIVVEESAAATP